PHSTAPRCGTCYLGSCSPTESVSRIQGRCVRPPRRTSRHWELRDQRRCNLASPLLHENCESAWSPPYLSSAVRRPTRLWPGKPSPDRSRLEGPPCNRRLSSQPFSSSLTIPHEGRKR